MLLRFDKTPSDRFLPMHQCQVESSLWFCFVVRSCRCTYDVAFHQTYVFHTTRSCARLDVCACAMFSFSTFFFTLSVKSAAFCFCGWRVLFVVTLSHHLKLHFFFCSPSHLFFFFLILLPCATWNGSVPVSFLRCTTIFFFFSSGSALCSRKQRDNEAFYDFFFFIVAPGARSLLLKKRLTPYAQHLSV